MGGRGAASEREVSKLKSDLQKQKNFLNALAYECASLEFHLSCKTKRIELYKALQRIYESKTFHKNHHKRLVSIEQIHTAIRLSEERETESCLTTPRQTLQQFNS